MSVPTSITDLSTTAGSNSPAGTDEIGTNLDDYIRAAFAIIKQNVSIGDPIASQNTISIPNEGGYFVVTGTTGITGINDTWNGRVVILKFSGIVTLTNSASLILFGADFTTAAGDTLILVNESAGVYRALSSSSATAEYITAVSTDTLTNKTIVAANNTITTAASGTLTQVELNPVIAEIAAEIAVTTADIATNADAIALNAPIDAPTFTGIPKADTAATTTDTTQLATTEFVQQEIAAIADSVTAWCYFDGSLSGENAPTAGNNIAHITADAAGKYTARFSTVMDNANYAIAFGQSYAAVGLGVSLIADNNLNGVLNHTTAGFSFTTAAGVTPGTLEDIVRCGIIVTGGLD